jgi:diguanylate cyclase
LAVNLAAIDLGVSQGAAVLGLLERAKVPPLPAFYRLFYDYVAGVRGLFASRVDDILGEGGEVGEKLYAEFVAPYETNEATERAIARISTRLRALDALIVQTASTAEMQSATLRGASAQFAVDTLDPALLRDWIERLETTNRNMRRVNAALELELREAGAELETTRHELMQSRELLARDPLTGLANRSGLDVQLGRAMLARGETGRPLWCAAVDIDHFKSLNDRYGHPVGDEVLRIVARALLASVRSADTVGRLGGDEFLVVLPEADEPVAQDIGERIRSAIGEADLRGVLGSGVLGGITVSVGLACCRDGDSITKLVARADRNLYEAKGRGRNRVFAQAEGRHDARLQATDDRPGVAKRGGVDHHRGQRPLLAARCLQQVEQQGADVTSRSARNTLGAGGVRVQSRLEADEAGAWPRIRFRRTRRHHGDRDRRAGRVERRAHAAFSAVGV